MSGQKGPLPQGFQCSRASPHKRASHSPSEASTNRDTAHHSMDDAYIGSYESSSGKEGSRPGDIEALRLKYYVTTNSALSALCTNAHLNDKFQFSDPFRLYLHFANQYVKCSSPTPIQLT